MTELNQIYKCYECGSVIEVVTPGTCAPMCCDKPMRLEKENTVDAALEKHLPVITETERGYKVVIGSEKHPMIPEHHIEWIELIADDYVYRKYLQVGAEPEAEFVIDKSSIKNLQAREHCNLHGLWVKGL